MDVRWTAHPAKHRPNDVLLVVAVVLIASWAVLASLGSVFLAALAAAILVASVSSFLVPTHYRLDDDGVEQRRLWGTRRRSWADLRRVQIGPGAALVSPTARPSWLDRHRGVYLYLDGADRDRVVAILKERVRP
jgi:hypothetical protein